ncbi:UNVERIFIED_CONTAM: hypothetical protein K2H54_033700 [Gekko kuhli]
MSAQGLPGAVQVLPLNVILEEGTLLPPTPILKGQELKKLCSTIDSKNSSPKEVSGAFMDRVQWGEETVIVCP